MDKFLCFGSLKGHFPDIVCPYSLQKGTYWDTKGSIKGKNFSKFKCPSAFHARL